MMAGWDGAAWLQRKDLVEEAAEREVGDVTLSLPGDVFDPDGIWLGTVATPRGLRVTEIGTDYVVGVWRDELDVEYIRVYDLEK